MKTILVVDDEKDILDFLKYNLQKEGYQVLTARNGKEALAQSEQRPHLILLDIMMPELDGWEVLKRLKSNPATADIPAIFLTAKKTDVDEVLGLELGADDFIVKPVSIPKLLARIKAALRSHSQTGAPRGAAAPITVGAIAIDPSRHTVHVDGAEVFFPKKEFEVLLHLASRAGHLVDREALLNAVWGSDVRVVDRTVDVHIRKIREKLGVHADYIETVKGVGYRLRDQQ
jgi:two-component system alkaline phosphatase synthesis response regulator PhoP